MSARNSVCASVCVCVCVCEIERERVSGDGGRTLTITFTHSSTHSPGSSGTAGRRRLDKEAASKDRTSFVEVSE